MALPAPLNVPVTSNLPSGANGILLSTSPAAQSNRNWTRVSSTLSPTLGPPHIPVRRLGPVELLHANTSTTAIHSNGRVSFMTKPSSILSATHAYDVTLFQR